MIEFELTIDIERPASDVFAFVADPENVPKWNYFVMEVRKTSESPFGVGATYHQTRKTDSQDLRVTGFEKDRSVTIETIPPSKPELCRTMIFSEENGKTQIADRWQLDTGHPTILQKLAAGRVKSGVEENLGKLKELLETGQTTLQDGRQISI
jgi:uncharacterized membrane protein